MKLLGTIIVLSATFCMNGCAETEKRAVPKPSVATAAETKSELVDPAQEQIRILRTELAGPALAASTWDIQTVDSTCDVGRSTSIAVDKTGHSHITYWDYTKGDLKYATLNC